MTRSHLSDRLLALSKADETEVFIAEKDRHLTRFANSEIHQNVAERDTEVRVRVVVDGRVGVASTNDLRESALAELVARATMLAGYAPERSDFPGLPTPQPIVPVPHAYVIGTARTTPEERAHAASIACGLATEAGLLAFGAFETATGRMTVANSHGLYALQEATKADFNLVVMSDDSSGYASYTAADTTGLDAEALARMAIDKALRGKHPTELAPGSYTVLLEPDAVADLLEHVAAAGLGGRSYVEGTSFLAGGLGERVSGENVTLYDDPLGADMLAVAFDAEGTPKRRLCLIERGIARAVAHDTLTAHRAGVTSTGHAFPAPNPGGPYPSHLSMEAGQTSQAELLRGIERGILVTRFHYTNLADARTATITGMTRDGTFWVERGEIVRPLKNMRFTTSALDALRHVRGASRETKLTLGWFGGTRAPALVIDGFRFSGVTNF